MANLTINWAYAVSGLLVGVLVGVTGVGGGSLMTPLLVLLFGVNPATAVGTDLLFACLTKTTGVAVHGLKHSIDWRIVRRLAAGSVPATAATLILLAYLGKSGRHGHDLITTVLGVALVLTAIALVFRQQMLSRVTPYMEGLGERDRRNLTVLVGFLIGVVVSISSVGAGAIGVTVLLILYPGLPTVRIVGSDIAHAVPLTLVAGLGHWMLGSTDFGVLASLLIGSVPGIMVSSLFANRIPERILRPVLAATLAVVGLRLAL
jgi:uncharacterized protein